MSQTAAARRVRTRYTDHTEKAQTPRAPRPTIRRQSTRRAAVLAAVREA